MHKQLKSFYRPIIIIEIFVHLLWTKPRPDRNYFISSHSITFWFFNSNKVNWKGQILIWNVTACSSFVVEKSIWKFMLCIRDQILIPALRDWWVSIWPGINVNSNCEMFTRETALMQLQPVSLFIVSMKLLLLQQTVFWNHTQNLSI